MCQDGDTGGREAAKVFFSQEKSNTKTQLEQSIVWLLHIKMIFSMHMGGNRRGPVHLRRKHTAY